MTERACAGCGEPLSPLARPNKRYHGSACRTRAYAKRRRTAARVAERNTPLGRMSVLTPEQQAVLDAATSEATLVARVAQAAASGNWRASAWLLERRFPQRWAPRQRERVVVRDVDADPDDDAFVAVDRLAKQRRKRLERRPEGY